MNIYNTETVVNKMDCVPDGKSTPLTKYYQSNTILLSYQTFFNGYNGATARGWGTMTVQKKIGGVWQDWNTELWATHTIRFYNILCSGNNPLRTDSDHKSSGHSLTVGVNNLGVMRTKGDECSSSFRIISMDYSPVYARLCD